VNRVTNKLMSVGPPHERRHPLENGGVKITTFVPIQFKKRGIKKVVVVPDGGTNSVSPHGSAPAITPTQDTPLLKALGRCYYWQHLLDSGAVVDIGEIATREGLAKITVGETMRLASLAPDIAEAILRGTAPRTVSRQMLVRVTLPLDWQKQREMIAGIG
jgi:hypothetical protein